MNAQRQLQFQDQDQKSFKEIKKSPATQEHQNPKAPFNPGKPAAGTVHGQSEKGFRQNETPKPQNY